MQCSQWIQMDLEIFGARWEGHDYLVLRRNHKNVSSYFQSERTDVFLHNVCELCLDQSQGGEIGWREGCCWFTATDVRKSNDGLWLALIEVQPEGYSKLYVCHLCSLEILRLF